MRKDPIVEEIHDTRVKLLEESGGDLKRFMQRLKALEEQDRERVVSPTRPATVGEPQTGRSG